jgi:hypothetical protein
MYFRAGPSKIDVGTLRSDGTLVLGGTLPASPNISLNANGEITGPDLVDDFGNAFTSYKIVTSSSAGQQRGQYVSTTAFQSTVLSPSGKSSSFRHTSPLADGTVITRFRVSVDGSIYTHDDTGDMSSFILSDGSASFAGDIGIGGTIPSTPNISLNADGSAQFGNNNVEITQGGVITGTRFKTTGDARDGAEIGWMVHTSRGVEVTRNLLNNDGSTGQPLIRGYATGNANPVFEVKTNGDIQSLSQNGGQLAGYRNQLINSSFHFDQRYGIPVGTNQPSLSNGDFVCDRWILAGNPTANWRNVGRVSAVLTGVSTSGIGLRFNDSGDGSSNKRLVQAIELPNFGINGQFAIGTTWTLSFWCDVDCSSVIPSTPIFRQTVVDSASQVLLDSGGPANYTSGQTIDGFTQYSATFTVDGDASSSAAASSIACLSVFIELPANSNSIIIAPQFEPGPVATPFEHLPMGTELALCQRYFFKTSGRLNASKNCTNSNAGTDDQGFVNVFFPVQMRAAGTVDSSTLSLNVAKDASIVQRSPQSLMVSMTSTTTSPSNSCGINAGLTVDAEL